MNDYTWVTLTAVALVSVMWYSPEWFKRYRMWRDDRRARREKARQVEAWLVTRLQMREDRHRGGIDKRDEF